MTSGRPRAAIRPATPRPMGMRTPDVTSSSSPTAASTASASPRSLSSSRTAKSALQRSRTRLRSSGMSSSRPRWVRPTSVTAWSRCRRSRARRSASCRRRVLERRAGPAAQLLREREVLGRVAALRVRVGEGHRAQDAPVGHDRDDHAGVQREPAQELEVLGVDGGGGQEVVADHRVELRAAGAQHGGHPAGGVRVLGVAPLELGDELLLVGLGVGHGQPSRRLPLAQHVHGAPVGQRRDRRVGDLAQGRLGVQRRAQRHGRLGQEGGGQLAPLAGASRRRPGRR